MYSNLKQRDLYKLFYRNYVIFASNSIVKVYYYNFKSNILKRIIHIRKAIFTIISACGCFTRSTIINYCTTNLSPIIMCDRL